MQRVEYIDMHDPRIFLEWTEEKLVQEGFSNAVKSFTIYINHRKN